MQIIWELKWYRMQLLLGGEYFEIMSRVLSMGQLYYWLNKNCSSQRRSWPIIAAIENHLTWQSHQTAPPNKIVYRTTCNGNVEFLVTTINDSLSLSSLLSSHHEHLPMNETSSIVGLKTTRSVRQIPSVWFVWLGSCSTDNRPTRRCCGTSAPNNSTMNFLNVEWRLLPGWISTVGKW